MIEIFKKIWSFINSKAFMYILIVIGILFVIRTCSVNDNLKNESKIKDQNISALGDTIKTEKLKNGNLEVSISGFVGTAKELEQYNSKLAQQVKDEKGKVISLNNLVFNLYQTVDDLKKQLDSTISYKPVEKDSNKFDMNWELYFNYDKDNYDIFKGTTEIGLHGDIDAISKVSVSNNKTFLTGRDSKMSLTWGQKYEKDKVRVFAQTSHPAFSAQLLEGVYVDYPKKKHWFTGFGIGPSINMGWNFFESKPALVVGVGLQYSIFEW